MRNSITAVALLAITGLSALSFNAYAVPAAPVKMAEEPHKHAEGEKHKLGRKTIAGYTVSVILVGEVEAGKHVDFDIKLIDAKNDPKALRVWVGLEDAKGAKKTDGVKGTATYTGEVDVPKPIPEKAKIWVEIETDAGVSKDWFEYDTHDHKH